MRPWELPADERAQYLANDYEDDDPEIEAAMFAKVREVIRVDVTGAIKRWRFLNVIERRRFAGALYRVMLPLTSPGGYQIAQPGRMLRILSRASLVRGAP